MDCFGRKPKILGSGKPKRTRRLVHHNDIQFVPKIPNEFECSSKILNDVAECPVVVEDVLLMPKFDKNEVSIAIKLRMKFWINFKTDENLISNPNTRVRG